VSVLQVSPIARAVTDCLVWPQSTAEDDAVFACVCVCVSGRTLAAGQGGGVTTTGATQRETKLKNQAAAEYKRREKVRTTTTTTRCPLCRAVPCAIQMLAPVHWHPVHWHGSGLGRALAQRARPWGANGLVCGEQEAAAAARAAEEEQQASTMGALDNEEVGHFVHKIIPIDRQGVCKLYFVGQSKPWRDD
jgi:hypothetical protein